MFIFKETVRYTHHTRISLIINQLKFIDMRKVTKSNPILNKDGVKNIYITMY